MGDVTDFSVSAREFLIAEVAVLLAATSEEISRSKGVSEFVSRILFFIYVGRGGGLVFDFLYEKLVILYQNV